MPKRYLPLLLVLGIALAFVVTGFVTSRPAPARPVKTVLPNKAGRVVFNHRQHAEEYKIKCAECHHENAEARDNPKPCASCHGQSVDDDFIKNHQASFAGDPQACLTCHHREFTPKWDKAMHERHAELSPDSCQSCHHDDSIEPEPMNCAECHETLEKGRPVPQGAEPLLMRDAAHLRCFACHEQSAATPTDEGCAECHNVQVTRNDFIESGQADLGPQAIAELSRCASCHYTQAVDELIPERMPAYHRQCGDCHTAAKKGPSVLDKQQCNQCHIE